jgi:hypothetical protein
MVCLCEVHGVDSSNLVLYAGILFGASVNNVLSMLQGSEEQLLVARGSKRERERETC